MATNKAGKYTKLTDETIKKLEEVFAIDGTIEEACFYADIRTQTYYNWIKEKPELKVRFDELRNRPVLKARQEVIKGLNCYSNAMDYLKRKKKLEFGDNVDMTTGGKPINILFDDPFKITSKTKVDSRK